MTCRRNARPSSDSSSLASSSEIRRKRGGGWQEKTITGDDLRWPRTREGGRREGTRAWKTTEQIRQPSLEGREPRARAAQQAPTWWQGVLHRAGAVCQSVVVIVIIVVVIVINVCANPIIIPVTIRLLPALRLARCFLRQLTCFRWRAITLDLGRCRRRHACRRPTIGRRGNGGCQRRRPSPRRGSSIVRYRIVENIDRTGRDELLPRIGDAWKGGKESETYCDEGGETAVHSPNIDKIKIKKIENGANEKFVSLLPNATQWLLADGHVTAANKSKLAAPWPHHQRQVGGPHPANS